MLYLLVFVNMLNGIHLFQAMTEPVAESIDCRIIRDDRQYLLFKCIRLPTPCGAIIDKMVQVC